MCASRIVVRIAGTDPTFASRLRDVPGISGFDRLPETGDGSLFEVETPVDGEDMRGAVSSFVVQNGWELLELKSIEMTLEDVFLRLTMDEEGAN